MELKFDGVRIAGVQLILPKREISFDNEVDSYSFTSAQSAKLKNVMGYDRRRVVNEGVTSSDLVVAGFEALIDSGQLDLESLDALIVVTQTPDFIMPGTSYIIHSRLPFGQDILCLDINQGCAGYIVGLTTAFSLLSQENFNRVALVNVDIVSRLVAQGDRNSRPIIGDAASITIIESDPTVAPTYGNLKVDGSGWDSLMVPAGGMKIRPSAATAVVSEDKNGNARALDNLVMKGDAVFNFVMQSVPTMIESLMDKSGFQISNIDNFLFHQPNPFMLKKLASKLDIPLEKFPINLVEKYGNSSGVTIPAVLCSEFDMSYFKEPKWVCMAGFGVGLTWGSLIIELHDLSFVELLEI
jgi:3-oxoacyl-[acyl-carrier-protein] synthase-3